MQQTSDTWKNLWANPNADLEYKIVFDGTDEYTDELLHPGIQLTRGVMPEDSFGIGTVAVSGLKFSVRAKETQPRATARVDFFVRLVLGDAASEWLPKGSYIVDSRKTTLNNVSFECLDAVAMLDEVWVTEVSPHYNPPMREVAQTICGLHDIEIENIDVIPEDYIIGNANDLTKRQVLGFIASACGCNAALNDAGRLEFYPLRVPSVTTDIGKTITSATEINDPSTARRLLVRYGNEDGAVIAAGTGDATQELYVYNEWMTEDMAAELLNRVRGYTYKPVEVHGAHIDPAFALGDGVTADGLTTQIWSYTTVYDGFPKTHVKVPGDGQLGGELGRYRSYTERDQERIINKYRGGLTVQCEHIGSDTTSATIPSSAP